MCQIAVVRRAEMETRSSRWRAAAAGTFACLSESEASDIAGVEHRVDNGVMYAGGT